MILRRSVLQLLLLLGDSSLLLAIAEECIAKEKFWDTLASIGSSGDESSKRRENASTGAPPTTPSINDSTEFDSPQVQCDPPCLGGKWNRVVVLGDLHGDYINAYILLRAARVVNEHGKWAAAPRTLLVQMGDIVDRGPDSPKIYELFQQLRSEAKENSGKVIQLLGNHEVMNLCGRSYYVHPYEIKAHYGDSREAMEKAWSADGKLGADIRKNFEVAAKVGEVIFVHAGLVPKFAGVPFDTLKEVILKQIEDGCPLLPYKPEELKRLAWRVSSPIDNDFDVIGELGPTWTRLLTMEPLSTACPLVERSLELVGGAMMVVGHTPTISGTIEMRCNNTLVLADTAISRYMGNTPKSLILEGGVWKELSFTFADAARRRVLPSMRTLFKHRNVVEGQQAATGDSGSKANLESHQKSLQQEALPHDNDDAPPTSGQPSSAMLPIEKGSPTGETHPRLTGSDAAEDSREGPLCTADPDVCDSRDTPAGADEDSCLDDPNLTTSSNVFTVPTDVYATSTTTPTTVASRPAKKILPQRQQSSAHDEL